MKKGGGLPTFKSVLVYTLYSLEKRPRFCSISDVCAKFIIGVDVIKLLLPFKNKSENSLFKTLKV